MANNQKNLVSLNDLSNERAREIRSMGGKAVVEKKRQKKAMKEMLNIILDLPLKSEKIKQEIVKMGINNEDVNNQTALLLKMFQKAMTGDVSAFNTLRDLSGNKPIDVVVQAEVSKETIEKIESYFDE